MATGTSFKQQCPSCEAMVPIRDPGLIGRKIDCPKCKYRFVVQEPADAEEEDAKPAKKSKAGDSKAAKGAAAKGAAAKGAAAKGAAAKGKAGPRQEDNDDEETPAQKPAGSGKTLILGVGLAGVALVAIIVCAVVFLSSGDDNKTNKGGGSPNTSMPPATGGTAKGGDTTPSAPVVLVNTSNLLPNDTETVISYPMNKTLGSALRHAALDAGGAFKDKRFKEQMGFGVDDVWRIITGLSITDNWVFTILQTKKPYKTDTMKAQLRLKAEPKLKSKSGKEYELFLINRDMDSLATLLLKANHNKDKFAVHFLDPNTIVFADPEPLRKFLTEDAKPEYLTKPPSPAASSSPATGTGSAPAAPGAPGIPPPPGNPTSAGAAGGGGGPGTPGTPGAPVGPGAAGNPGAAAAGAPGAPNPGGHGGPGKPGMPGGMGMPGATQNKPPEAPPSASYLTVKPHLKNMLDKIEKLEENKETKKKEAASAVTIVSEWKPLFRILEKSQRDQMAAAGVKMSLVEKVQFEAAMIAAKTLSAVGLSIAVYNQETANVVAAIDAGSRDQAGKLDKLLRTGLPMAPPLIKGILGLTVTTPNTGGGRGMMPGAPGVGMQLPGGAGGLSPPGAQNPGGMNPGGMNPGGMNPGGLMPPGGPGLPGGPGNPGGAGKEEEKNDGTLKLVRDDELLIGTLELNLTPAAYELLSRYATGLAMQLKGDADLATNRLRVQDLAATTQAYLKTHGAFPQGAMPRAAESSRGLPYRPDQRLSWAVALLPHFGEEFAEWKPNPNLDWNQGENLSIAERIVPQLLVQTAPQAGPVRIQYPNMPPGTPMGATHFVGMAGLGLDAAEYTPGNPATDKKRGIFNYDHATRADEIKDGLDKTILLIMVRDEHKAPWMAGGGATVRAVADDDEAGKPIAPFVCWTYPSKPDAPSKWDGKRGTIAIMADGKVRFIPEDIPSATFRALCTIAGGEKIDKLNDLCPVIEDEERELKTDPDAPKPGLPAVPPAPGKASASDQERLQGTWQVTSMVKDGKVAPAAEAAKLSLTFSKNQAIADEAGKKETNEYRINSSTTPKQFDLLPSAGSKEMIKLGIYDLQGDTLKLCLGDTRPTEFAGKPKTMFVELKRVK